MKRSIYRGLFLVLMVVLPVLADDATPGEVRKVEVSPANGAVRIEITLSSAVTPAVETAQHPDRLVLKLPGTVSGAQQKRVAVGQFGVRAVRYGLNRSDPPETHLIVDLDQERSYKLSTEGNKVILLVEAPAAAAAPSAPVNATPREVRNVEISHTNGDVRIEITLSSAVTPAVETAQHPDRLVLKLPDTVSAAQQKRVAIREFGVRSIRYGLNQSDPPVTHLVVDLDQEHTYKLSTAGNKVILVVEAPLSLVTRQRAAPAAAASAPLINSLGGRSGSATPSSSQSTQEAVLLTPPPPGPPINFPAATPDSQSASRSGSSSGRPSAAHPNRASLQEGTVFPNEGNPGAGVVPPVSGFPSATGFDAKSTQNSAKANVPSESAHPALPQEAKPGTNASSEAAASVRQDTVSLPPSSGQNAAAVPGQNAPPAPPTAEVASLPVVEKKTVISAIMQPDIALAPAPKPAEAAPQVAVVPASPTAEVAGLPVAQNKLALPAGAQPDVTLAPAPKPVETPVEATAAPAPVVPAPPSPADANVSVAESQPVVTAPAVPAPTSDNTPLEPDKESQAALAALKPVPIEPVEPVEPVEPAPTTGAGEGRVPRLMTRPGENPDFRMAFRVKYVAADAAYLDGGRAGGLTEGMKLVVRDLPNSGGVAALGSDSSAAGDVAELEVLSVAETSAVTEIHAPKRPVKIGDFAYLSSADQQALVEKNALSATRKYPAVVSFTENDTLDEEARAVVPKPPLPSINRSRGRIGFDYIGVMDHSGSGMQTSNLGMVVQADITRLNGTYWNVSGYWRGRFDHTSAGPQTLQDTINRTYHLFTSYENPRSAWVLGFGRMYLPWASSLDTLDGGYFGRKLKTGVTSGVFLGSTPDPSSYGYNPNREIGGGFINFQGGSYDDFHYTSTSGGGLGMLKWAADRPFLFFENSLFYKRVFSVYQASQIDNRQGYWYMDPTKNANVWQPGTGWGPGRSFTTVRFQPHPRIELSANHTYFRDLPTFDASLVGTGLLDKYLFQGFSAGARVQVVKQIWLSSDTGFGNRSGDKKNSLNETVGVTFGHLPWIGVHTDLRYSRFNSSFGSGSYKSLTISKNLGETFQLQILAGQQNFASVLSSANQSRYVNAMVETALSEHYFVQGGATISRGGVMNYDQWIFTFGYRFDNRHGHRGQ